MPAPGLYRSVIGHLQALDLSRAHGFNASYRMAHAQLRERHQLAMVFGHQNSQYRIFQLFALDVLT